jgi:hypothetical protein
VVRASKDGYQELGDRTMQVTGGDRLELDLLLTPGAHDSVDVHETATAIEQSPSGSKELHVSDVKNLPSRPATVTDVLPLVPSVVKSPEGEIKIDGSGEHRGAFIVNQADITDPATGKFGQNRFSRSIDARLDRDHLALERWCSHFSSRIAIKAVQIWMRRAFSLVPTKLFTLRFCLSALKNNSISQRSL